MFGIAAGVLFALVSARALRSAPDVIRTRYFLVCFGYAALIVVPAGLGLYVLYPDWSLMYFANPEHLPLPIVLPALLAAYALGAPSGFLLTHRLGQEPRRWPLRLFLLLVLASFSVVMGVGWNRLTTVAYYDAFHHGLASMRLLSSALLLPALLSIAALIGTLVACLRRIASHLDALDALPSDRSDSAVAALGTVSAP